MFERLFRPAARSPLIEAAFRDMAIMLDQAERMLGLALSALLEGRPLEVDLEVLDDVVDEGERSVRRSVLEHLSFDPSRDLVASLVLVSMVQDAERLGD
jgi:phosphate uptake regulator